MNFGIPKKRNSREEKYPSEPVLTLGIDEGKGKAKSIILNSKAVEELGLDAKKGRVAFAFEGGMFIANAEQDGIDEKHSERVTKSYPRKVNSKRTYDYISKIMNLDNSIEHEFTLNPTQVNDINLFRLFPRGVMERNADEVIGTSNMNTEEVDDGTEDIKDYEETSMSRFA
jgi:hypothetical protein